MKYALCLYLWMRNSSLPKLVLFVPNPTVFQTAHENGIWRYLIRGNLLGFTKRIQAAVAYPASEEQSSSSIGRINLSPLKEIMLLTNKEKAVFKKVLLLVEAFCNKSLKKK